MSQARIIQVIQTDDLRGSGVDGDPYRRVDQYYMLEGVLLWEHDAWLEDREQRKGAVSKSEGGG